MPSSHHPTAVCLDAETVLFLEGPVSIIVAARADGLATELMQAVGARVNDDGTLSVIVARDEGPLVLRAIDTSRSIAVVFSRPSTHQTVQLKSSDARWAPATEVERAVALGYRSALRNELASVGFGGAYADAIVGASNDLISIRFTPHEAYQQTPGPNAGAALGVAGAPRSSAR